MSRIDERVEIMIKICIYIIVLVPPISFGLNRLFEPISAPGIRPLDAVEGKNRTR
jgi:hypothetical protein